MILGTVHPSLLSIQLSFLVNQLQNLIQKKKKKKIYNFSQKHNMEHSFYPFIFAKKVTSTSESMSFLSLHAPFLSLWTILLLFMKYYSASSLTSANDCFWTLKTSFITSIAQSEYFLLDGLCFSSFSLHPIVHVINFHFNDVILMYFLHLLLLYCIYYQPFNSSAEYLPCAVLRYTVTSLLLLHLL